ncbi:MAG: hypothetical protein AAGK02_04700, partial [Pseudomonadota bacterium]
RDAADVKIRCEFSNRLPWRITQQVKYLAARPVRQCMKNLIYISIGNHVITYLPTRMDVKSVHLCES